jgi:hypothetical protein
MELGYFTADARLGGLDLFLIYTAQTEKDNYQRVPLRFLKYVSFTYTGVLSLPSQFGVVQC